MIQVISVSSISLYTGKTRKNCKVHTSIMVQMEILSLQKEQKILPPATLGICSLIKKENVAQKAASRSLMMIIIPNPIHQVGLAFQVKNFGDSKSRSQPWAVRNARSSSDTIDHGYLLTPGLRMVKVPRVKSISILTDSTKTISMIKLSNQIKISYNFKHCFLNQVSKTNKHHFPF